MASNGKKSIPALQSSDHFLITPSDTLAIKDDPGNPSTNYTFCYVHNANSTGKQIRVKSVDGTDGLLYLNPGQTSDIMVQQVYATTPTTTTADVLYAHISRGGSF